MKGTSMGGVGGEERSVNYVNYPDYRDVRFESVFETRSRVRGFDRVAQCTLEWRQVVLR